MISAILCFILGTVFGYFLRPRWKYASVDGQVYACGSGANRIGDRNWQPAPTGPAPEPPPRVPGGPLVMPPANLKKPAPPPCPPKSTDPWGVRGLRDSPAPAMKDDSIVPIEPALADFYRKAGQERRKKARVYGTFYVPPSSDSAGVPL